MLCYALPPTCSTSVYAMLCQVVLYPESVLYPTLQLYAPCTPVYLYISNARHRCQRNISLSVRPSQPSNHPDSHQLSVKLRKKEIVCLNRAGRIFPEMESQNLIQCCFKNTEIYQAKRSCGAGGHRPPI